jgi:hypothetical protein
MAATIQPIPTGILRKARRIASPHGGKEALHKAAGISKTTLTALLGSGEALPATVEKLEAGLEKLKAKKTTTTP